VEPLAIHHVAINVSDVGAGVAFYTDVLGGTLRQDRPDFGLAGAWIDLGGQQVHLLEAPVRRDRLTPGCSAGLGAGSRPFRPGRAVRPSTRWHPSPLLIGPKTATGEIRMTNRRN